MKKLILINAIVWASIVMVGAYLFKGDENWKYFFGLILVAFSIVNCLMANLIKKDKKSCSAFR
ncbi:hypothetical protein [Olleya namhaensis]|uniref:Uncharacterized protein n=1 Tax=Olleya namhaensis TaxID=1144750 RepID=A0A1I3T3A7_9FLAO|nr:hypothetical protein [Olleya namhaensis]SFJ64156.1 hypothetical protein SAMN05443431_11317 [Olleya namhaensis]